MRRLALLPAALLLTALQAVAAEYGSLTRVAVSGTIHTPVSPPVTNTASGITTFRERTTTTSLANADILRAMVERSLIPTAAGYQLGLLNTASLDVAGEFIAYRPTGPASTARRVPTDLLSLHLDTGPREGFVRRNASDALLSINLTSRDYATLSVLDFEGVSILTQRFTNNTRQKPPHNQVILLSASGSFPGVNAPDTGPAGLGTLTVTFADARIVDLEPYGTVAPGAPASSSTGSGTLILNGGGTSTGGGTSVLGGTLSTGTTLSGGTAAGIAVTTPTILTSTNPGILSGSSTITPGSLTNVGTGTLTLTGANTYSGTTTISSGNFLIGGNTYGAGTFSLSGDGFTLVPISNDLTFTPAP